MRTRVFVLGSLVLAGCLDDFPAPPGSTVAVGDRRDRGLGLDGQPALEDEGVGRPRTDSTLPPPRRFDGAMPDADRPPPRDASRPPPPDAARPPRRPDEGMDLPPDAEVAPPAPRAVRGDVVINEVDYDQPRMDHDEYVELLVVARHPVSLGGMRVEFYNGSGFGEVACNDVDAPPLSHNRYRCVVLPNRVLRGGDRVLLVDEAAQLRAPEGVEVLAVLGPADETAIENGSGDGLALVGFNNDTIDGVAWGQPLDNVGEGLGAPTDADGDGQVDEQPPPPVSLSRCADGEDTDDNKVDFVLTPLTPGAPNSCR